MRHKNSENLHILYEKALKKMSSIKQNKKKTTEESNKKHTRDIKKYY